MRTKLKLLVAGAVLSLSLIAPVSYAATGTSDVFQNNPGCSSASGTNICGGTSGDGLFAVIRSIIQVLLIAGGVIAVIMIIIGGLRYMTSNGEQAQVKAAKDTILYAIVGLVVTMVAYAIVTWAVGKV
jgi:Type IV secretion system pilin